MVAPMCNLGPKGGVCACVDQPLLGDPPNLFFVLDRSGSMNNAWTGSQVSKWTAVVNTLSALVPALGPRASYGVAVFPDPRFANVANCASSGPAGTCAPCAPGVPIFPGIRGVPVLRGDAPAGTLGPVEIALSAMLNRVGAFGGTPTAATLAALAPMIESLPGKTYVIFATDGGPNCDSSLSCVAATCTSNIENDQGCPPSGPNCCDPKLWAGATLNCLDAQPTIAAVTAIAGAGIPVYVIGVPQSEPYATLLDELARAGGTARGSEPQYYAAAGGDPSALLTSLKKIAAQITGTCKLTLNNSPPDSVPRERVLRRRAPAAVGAERLDSRHDARRCWASRCRRCDHGDGARHELPGDPRRRRSGRPGRRGLPDRHAVTSRPKLRDRWNNPVSRAL